MRMNGRERQERKRVNERDREREERREREGNVSRERDNKRDKTTEIALFFTLSAKGKRRRRIIERIAFFGV